MSGTTLQDFLDAAQRYDARGYNGDGGPCLTLVGRTSRGLGVRPRVVDRRQDGTKTYMLTRRQVQRVIDRWPMCANPSNKESEDER